jgi:hypothetical protein
MKNEVPRIGLTGEERIKVEQARFNRRVGTGVLIFLGVVVLAFVIPLSVFLTRIASGG